MTWKMIVGCMIGALVIVAIDKAVGGLSHAALLAVGLVVILAVGALTFPDAGGLRRPREH